MFRIVKKSKGFIVEKKVPYWTLFGIKYKWKPYVLTSGSNEAWHHSTYDFALINLFDQIKNEDLK